MSTVGAAGHALTALDGVFTRRSMRSCEDDRLDAATVQSLLEADWP